MRVDDMISRATITSGRSLLAISSVIVASRVLDFPLDHLPLFSQGGLKDDTLAAIALPLIIFLALAHILNWLNDHNGYVFKLHSEGLLPLIKGIAIDIDTVFIQRNHKSDSISRINNLTNRLEKLTKPFNILWASITLPEYIAIYGQHFFIPCGFAAGALYLL